jgi:uncharacterized protein
MNKLFMLAVAILLLGGASDDRNNPAEQLRPSFPCLKSDTSLVSRNVCSDPDLTRIELQAAQAYFAFKASMHGRLTGELKDLSNARNGTMNRKCAKAVDAKVCIADFYRAFREALINAMIGPAKEEASRPLNDHVALELKLKALGFLRQQFGPIGVYGPDVRAAIRRWQETNGRQVTGILGDNDAAVLAASQ